jgi:hypothetical protein
MILSGSPCEPTRANGHASRVKLTDAMFTVANCGRLLVVGSSKRLPNFARWTRRGRRCESVSADPSCLCELVRFCFRVGVKNAHSQTLDREQRHCFVHIMVPSDYVVTVQFHLVSS